MWDRVFVRAFLCAVGLGVAVGGCGGERGPAWNLEPHARVDALLGEMAQPDPVVRRDAATALGGIWPAGARAVPVLAAALDDEDARVREAAAASLAALGDRAVAPVAAFLADEDDDARTELVDVTDRIIELGAKVTPKDVADLVRHRPRAGLVFLASASTRWRRGSTRGDDPLVASLLAFYAHPANLEATGRTDPALPGLAAACTALYGLSSLPRSPTRAMPETVLALLASDEPAVAAHASALVWTAGTSHPTALAALRELAHRESFAGGDIARLLMQHLEADEPTVPEASTPNDAEVEALLDRVLIRLDGDAGTFWYEEAHDVLETLRRAAPGLGEETGRHTARSMASLLTVPEATWLRREILAVIAALGTRGAPAVPTLLAELAAAHEAWNRIFPTPDTDPAAAYVDHTVDYHRAFHSRLGIVDALGAIGEAAKEARPLLETLAAAEDPLLAYHAARALRRM